MDVEEVIYDGTSKFMRDGETYESHKDAHDKSKEYEENNFEVRIVAKEDKHYVYTRRVVTEVVVEGEAPV